VCGVVVHSCRLVLCVIVKKSGALRCCAIGMKSRVGREEDPPQGLRIRFGSRETAKDDVEGLIRFTGTQYSSPLPLYFPCLNA
jgi:hypothetical protein